MNKLKSQRSVIATFAIFVAGFVVMLVGCVFALNYLFGVGVGISILAMPLFLLAIGLAMDDFQRLEVAVPVPETAPLEVALMLTSVADGEIYKYLMKCGGKKGGGNTNETLIDYAGSRIFDAKTETFNIKGRRLAPDNIKVNVLFEGRLV